MGKIIEICGKRKEKGRKKKKGVKIGEVRVLKKRRIKKKSNCFKNNEEKIV